MWFRHSRVIKKLHLCACVVCLIVAALTTKPVEIREKTMEIVQEFSKQYVLYIPMALVIFGAILLFTFGFKSVEQPPFHKLTTDDKKSAGKKRKIKEKKSTANGHVPSGESRSEKSPSKKLPARENLESKPEKKDKKVETKQLEKSKKNNAKPKNNVEDVKNKKNLKKSAAEKPLDFDEGDWEMVPSKADKKKKEQSPAKKEKNSKKSEKLEKAEIEKLVKEVVNKELREKEKEKSVEKELPKVDEILVVEASVAVVEEKKEKEKKKKEKKAKKEATEKQPVGEEIKETDSAPVELPKVVKNIEREQKEEQTQPKEIAPVFDELGDVWTETKAAKKSKKKARRDN